MSNVVITSVLPIAADVGASLAGKPATMAHVVS